MALETTENSSPIKVLYIMGAGRSGSTVLNALLGSHRQVEGVGELIHLPELGWQNNDFCACGQEVRSCPFWHQVLDAWNPAPSPDHITHYLSLRSHMYGTGPRTLSPKLTIADTSSVAFRRFADLTASLYRAIANVSGASIVVDSSKSPRYGYLLSRIPALDLRLVHLVRDARGVAWSYAKSVPKDRMAGVQREMKPIPPAITALRWSRVNAQAEWVMKQPGIRGVRVHYEDLLMDTHPTIKRIGDLFGMDYDGLDFGGIKLNFAHTVAGNRVRRQPQTHLLKADEWREKMPRQAQTVAATAALIPMLRYGYLLNISKHIGKT